jgi:hypothetical protein
MVERELNAIELDERMLLDLVRSTDPVGVLSIYIDAHSGAPDPGPRSWAIDLDNRLAELERRIADNGRPELENALRRALVRIRPLLERKIDPRSSGRGRALFVWLDRLDVTSFSSQMRLPTRVVLDTSPFVHPLLELLDLGRPAGVALTTGDQVELLDWRLGELRTLARIAPDVPSDPERQEPGPVSNNAARAQLTTPGRELRARRERERRRRLLVRAAVQASRLVDERGWEHILVSGDDRLTTAFIQELPDRHRDRAIRDPRLLTGAAPRSLADLVGDRFAAERAQRNLELSRRARDATFGPGAALGLSEVLAALNQARVAHLIYDPDVRYQGAMDADGWLYVESETPAGNVATLAEPRLTERLVERSLDTAARVTPVAGAAAGPLADADGIAALLRW